MSPAAFLQTKTLLPITLFVALALSGCIVEDTPEEPAILIQANWALDERSFLFTIPDVHRETITFSITNKATGAVENLDDADIGNPYGDAETWFEATPTMPLAEGQSYLVEIKQSGIPIAKREIYVGDGTTTIPGQGPYTAEYEYTYGQKIKDSSIVYQGTVTRSVDSEGTTLEVYATGTGESITQFEETTWTTSPLHFRIHNGNVLDYFLNTTTTFERINQDEYSTGTKESYLKFLQNERHEDRTGQEVIAKKWSAYGMTRWTEVEHNQEQRKSYGRYNNLWVDLESNQVFWQEGNDVSITPEDGRKTDSWDEEIQVPFPALDMGLPVGNLSYGGLVAQPFVVGDRFDDLADDGYLVLRVDRTEQQQHHGKTIDVLEIVGTHRIAGLPQWSITVANSGEHAGIPLAYQIQTENGQETFASKQIA